LRTSAEAIKRFITYMKKEHGVSRRYEFNTLHFGVYPHGSCVIGQV